MGLLYASPIILVLLVMQLFPRNRSGSLPMAPSRSLSAELPGTHASSLLHIDHAEIVNNFQGGSILTPAQRSEFVALVYKRLHEK